VAWLADARPSRMSPLPSRHKIAPLRVTVARAGSSDHAGSYPGPDIAAGCASPMNRAIQARGLAEVHQ
jgi:hypothetical protein